VLLVLLVPLGLLVLLAVLGHKESKAKLEKEASRD